jgi:hypothetical protein
LVYVKIRKLKQKRIEYIRSLLHNDDVDVKIEAIYALINLLEFKAKPILEIAFRSEKDEFVRLEYQDQFDEMKIVIIWRKKCLKMI